EGKPYKSSGGAMSPSELGDIPAGWKVLIFQECLKHLIDNRGKTPQFFESGIPALSAKFVKGGFLINQDSFNYVALELFDSSEKLEVGDIIMTSEAPLGELFYIAKNTNYYPAQRVFALRANPEIISPSYFNYWLASPLGQSLIKRRGTGSTVQGIKQSELYKCEVLIPKQEIMERASGVFSQVLLKKEVNGEQIQILAKTRDTLLPKLMSGQIRIKE
ncbi:MAG: restriction endonuclease subunit S, partial [Sphaerospermopsis kisseleviana]